MSLQVINTPRGIHKRLFVLAFHSNCVAWYLDIIPGETAQHSFKQQLIYLLWGKRTSCSKWPVVLRYLLITYSMTLFTFILLVILRYTNSNTNSNTTHATNMNNHNDAAIPITTVCTDIASTMVQLIWALSPLCATLLICYGPYKHRYAPVSRSPGDNIIEHANMAYTVWNWKMRIYYHLNALDKSDSDATEEINEKNDVINDVELSSDTSNNVSITSPSSLSPIVSPRFPIICHSTSNDDNYFFIVLSWMCMCLMITSFASFIQYVFCIILFGSNWYSLPFVSKIQSVLHIPLFSPSSIILIAFTYTFFFGCLWDLFPSISVDWGQGIGFSGCSWLLLAYIEEIGWSICLFPSLLNYMYGDIRRASIWTGIIWSSWHFPAILFNAWGIIPQRTGYTVGEITTPVVYGLFMFTITTISLRILICHVSICSGTIWTSVLFHALHNTFAISFFSQLSDPSIHLLHIYMSAEPGFILTCIYCFIACYFMYGWKHTFDNVKM